MEQYLEDTVSSSDLPEIGDDSVFGDCSSQLNLSLQVRVAATDTLPSMQLPSSSLSPFHSFNSQEIPPKLDSGLDDDLVDIVPSNLLSAVSGNTTVTAHICGSHGNSNTEISENPMIDASYSPPTSMAYTAFDDIPFNSVPTVPFNPISILPTYEQATDMLSFNSSNQRRFPLHVPATYARPMAAGVFSAHMTRPMTDNGAWWELHARRPVVPVSTTSWAPDIAANTYHQPFLSAATEHEPALPATFMGPTGFPNAMMSTPSNNNNNMEEAFKLQAFQQAMRPMHQSLMSIPTPLPTQQTHQTIDQGSSRPKKPKSVCVCPNCQRSMKKGQRSNYGPRQHNCHIPGCGKVYERTSHLKAHLRWHNSNGPYVCNWMFCGKRFTQSEELERHILTHSDLDRPFTCTKMSCKERFNRMEDLVTHQKLHDDQLQFSPKGNSKMDSKMDPKMEVKHKVP